MNDLASITVTLSPDLESVGLSREHFDNLFASFKQRVDVSPVVGYRNLSLVPTHAITAVTQEGQNYQAKITFLENLPLSVDQVRELLQEVMADTVTWRFAVSDDHNTILTIEAVTK
jgi:hypothetical protein